MKRNLILCLILIAATTAVFGQVISFDFVHYDDNAYVTDNGLVQAGLTMRGLSWAFATYHQGYWQPVTWLSHMLDCEIFGVNAGGHHATNVALHIINSLLLFGLLETLTTRRWCSVIVAAVFAIHPLHVESVAWVAERKDVLSTMFGLAALWAYVGYARRGGAGRYVLTAALLALGLMAKPMLVTWPIVMLLLDFWPIERMCPRGLDADKTGKKHIALLVIEKIPLLAICIASSVITFLNQQAVSTVASTVTVPMMSRLDNAAYSYVWYMAKAIWPTNLAVLYTHPLMNFDQPIPDWQIFVAMALLAGVTAMFIAGRHRRYAIFGWLWYLVTLAPMIGIVQVDMQARADRYTYIPLIGLFITVVWGGADLLIRMSSRWRIIRPAVTVLVVCVLFAYGAVAWQQVKYWRNSATLFEHALESAPNNPIMHIKLADVLAQQDKSEQAIEHHQKGISLALKSLVAYFNMGVQYNYQGDIDNAISCFQQIVNTHPQRADAHYALAKLFEQRGKIPETIYHLEFAVTYGPKENFADDARRSLKLYFDAMKEKMPGAPVPRSNIETVWLAIDEYQQV